MEFKIDGEYIELIKLLKACGIAETGGIAKRMVEAEMVRYNGNIDLRKRLKVRKGDRIEIDGTEIKII